MLTNLKIPKVMDLFSVPRLDDIEVDERMHHFEQLLKDLEWKNVKELAIEVDIECNRIKTETSKKIAEIEGKYKQKKTELTKQIRLDILRMRNSKTIRILEEMDKHVTDVILAVHHRLGRIDHHEHKKAYKRILYALIVQALCRLLEPEAVVIFRVADVTLGKTVLRPAQIKYKELTGMEVVLQADAVNHLPLESCGGVNVSSLDGNRTVTNTLAGRLDNLLFKLNPVIRIVLYGENYDRRFFDLSVMCGSSTLFGPRIPERNKKKKGDGKVLWD